MLLVLCRHHQDPHQKQEAIIIILTISIVMRQAQKAGKKARRCEGRQRHGKRMKCHSVQHKECERIGNK